MPRIDHASTGGKEFEHRKIGLRIERKEERCSDATLVNELT
jgi:hypothetical protein